MSTIQNIGLGSAPNDNQGDPLRTGGTKINANFAALNTDKIELTRSLAAGTTVKEFERKDNSGNVIFALYTVNDTDQWYMVSGSNIFMSGIGNIALLPTGQYLRLTSVPSNSLDAANKAYVDAKFAAVDDRIKLVVHTIDAGQLLIIATIPFEMLPAVAGIGYKIHSCFAKYTFASSNYDPEKILIKNTAGDTYLEFEDILINQTVTTLQKATEYDSSGAGVHQPLIADGNGIFITSDTDPVAGDGELTVYIYYSEVPF